MLFMLPELRTMVEEIEPRDGASIVYFQGRTKTMVRSKVEAAAVKRALLSHVLDAAEKAIKYLPFKEKQVYKLRYRKGMTTRQIAQRLKICTGTVCKRIAEVRAGAAGGLQDIPASETRALAREFYGDKE